MRRLSKVLVLAALVVAVGFLPARAEPSTPFQLEARVPASTLAFLSVEEVGKWEERVNATSWGKLAADPEMQAFIAPIQEALGQLLEGGMLEMPPFVPKLIEHMQGLKGQLAVALVDIDPQQETVHAALSLDFGGNVDDFMKFLIGLKDEMDPEGQHVQTMEKDGRTWWQVPIPNAPFSIYATTVDTAFVVTTDEGLMTSILAGPQDGAMASDETFVTTRRKAGGGDLAMLFYGNVGSALAKFGEMMPPEVTHIGNALGLDTVKSIAYGMSFSGDGYRDTLLIHAPGADHGLIPFMEMKPMTAPKTLDLAPAGTFYWAEVSLPLDELLARVRALAGGVDPDFTEQMDRQLEGLAQMLGVDVEKELLAGFTGAYGAYAAFPQTGGLYPEVALIFEIKDAQTFEGVFDRFAQGVAGLLNEEGDILASTREMPYHGTTMHLFEMQAARGDDPVPFTPTWAVIGNRMVMTLVPHAMKEIILRANGEVSDPGLASKEDFRSLRSLMPQGAGGMEYLNLKGGLALLYDTVVPLLQTVAKPNVMEDFPVPLDWSLLPPASRVVKHFRSMASYMTWNGDGITISIQGPIPMLPLIGMAAGAATFLAVGRAVPGPMDIMVEDGVIEVPGEDLEAEMDLELAKIQAEMLLEAVEFYRLEKEALPGSLQELVDAGYMGSVPQDPWDGAYQLVKKDGGYAIVSAGPDKQVGTPDDIRLEK